MKYPMVSNPPISPSLVLSAIPPFDLSSTKKGLVLLFLFLQPGLSFLSPPQPNTKDHVLFLLLDRFSQGICWVLSQTPVSQVPAGCWEPLAELINHIRTPVLTSLIAFTARVDSAVQTIPHETSTRSRGTGEQRAPAERCWQ